MDILTLRVFVTVADCGSVTGAARGLGYSQPGMSHRLQCLERLVGCRLFARDAGRMRLTTVGLAMLPYARMILVLSDQMCLEAPSRAGEQGSPALSPGRVG